MDTDAMPPRLDESKSATASEHTANGGDEMKKEVTLREDSVYDGSATPKDMRFWMIITSLLIATFLSALDLTGNIHYLLTS
jgi:hypothetical protein